ncbi:MAG: hypothetical protein HY905_16460 [Deltaproteobacteria bacterium]|nr:hypothetical protein [Deltaproteobacteria bacterium]
MPETLTGSSLGSGGCFVMSERPEVPVPIELPFFDPKPSARFGAEILGETGQPFALIGKIAMWAHLPPAAQEFTKDVDFAVPLRAIEPIKAALARRGIAARPLSIGGLAVREGEIRVDFIDRHEGGLGALFEEAITDAARLGVVAGVGTGSVPVAGAEYLVALKVVTGEDKDETDAVKLLRRIPTIDLARTRALILRHGGTAGANRLDALARRAGRPDARPEERNGGD